MARQCTRRELLRYFGLAGSAAVLAACQPKVVEVTKIVEKEVEKVVKETVIVAGTPKVVEKVVKKSTHRSLDDIRESIEEIRFYRQHVFRIEAL